MGDIDTPQHEQTTLATELYNILDKEGEQGVRTKIMQIRSRPGADRKSLTDVQSLRAAIDYFNAETRADSSSRCSRILRIIEVCGFITITNPKPISEVTTKTAQAARQVANSAWRRGGGHWNLDDSGEVRLGRDDLMGLEEY